MSCRKNKIGILGGSFDPVHNGHLAIALAAVREFGLDEVWLVPTGHSPNKDEREMTSPELRAQMVELAVAPFPRLKLSRLELDAERTSYTYLTLRALKEKYPDTIFYFIMGADSLDYFEEWRHPEIICQCAEILAAVRGQWDRDACMEKIAALTEKFHAGIHLLSCERFDASSRGIRAMLKEGKSAEGLLPEAVYGFIRENHLYE